MGGWGVQNLGKPAYIIVAHSLTFEYVSEFSKNFGLGLEFKTWAVDEQFLQKVIKD